MKKLNTGIAFAGLLLAGVLAGKVLTAAEVGVPISDAQAATLLGGCKGTDGVTCSAGDCGAVNAYYVDGSKNMNQSKTSGSVYCGNGDGNCVSCFTATRCND